MSRITRFPIAKMALAVGALCGASNLVSAQTILEEVIVTSQLRAESVQDVSVSVNVVSADKILEAGITKVEDLQAYVPNLTMSETGIGTNIYIRGIGSGINQGFDQSVGMYVDGVAYSRAQLTRAPFLDLARVEVLRGPQNILFGKNSVAGAINLHTARPGDEFEGSVGVTFEPEYGERIFDLVLSSPITDSLGVRLAHRTRKLDGYIENIDGGDEPERDEQTTRLVVDWDISDKSNAMFKYESGDFDVRGRQVEIVNDFPSLNPAFGGASWSQILASFGAPASVLNNTLDFQRSSNGDFSLNSTENITFEFDYSFEHFDFKSITASLEYDYNERCDCDFTSAPIFFVESEEDYSQLSQEFRFTSNGDGFIEWVGGLYFSSSELDFNDDFFSEANSPLGNILEQLLPTAFDPTPDGDVSDTVYVTGAAQQLVNISVPRVFEQETDLFSAFLQFTFNLSDRSRLILGGRYSNEEKEATRTLTYRDADDGEARPYNDTLRPNTEMGVDYLLGAVLQVARYDLAGKREKPKFAPSIIFEQDLSDDAMAYVTWSEGFKSGGYDVRSNVAPDLSGGGVGYFIDNPINSALDVTVREGSFEFDEEEAQTIELGLKATLLDGAMELNAAAFYTEFEDLQVSIYDGVLGFRVDNAAKATTQGLEIDSRWALTESLSMTGSLAWLDFEFDEFPQGQCTQAESIARAASNDPSTDCDYAGKTNQYVADFSGSVSFNYDAALGDQVRLRGALDVIYTDSYNPSQNLDPLIQQDGYTKLNLRIGLAAEDDTWEVALLAKNVTDEEIITYANDTPLASNLTQSIGHYAFVEPPRTVALQAAYRF